MGRAVDRELIAETNQVPEWAVSLPGRRKPTPWLRMIGELKIRPWLKVANFQAGFCDPQLSSNLKGLQAEFLATQMDGIEYAERRAGLLTRQGVAKIWVAINGTTFFQFVGKVMDELPEQLRGKFRVLYEPDPSRLRFRVEFSYADMTEFSTFVSSLSNQLSKLPI
jgi:hypothetical protein